jgi:hypothetical protein
MRIKVVQAPAIDEVDGIDLKRFEVGQKYEVGPEIGGLMLAEAWAEPVGEDEPAWPVPFSDSDPFMSRVVDRSSPPNLTRETYPPYAEATLAAAADFPRRKRSRAKQ